MAEGFQRLTPQLKGEIPLLHKSGDKPPDPTTLVSVQLKKRPAFKRVSLGASRFWGSMQLVELESVTFNRSEKASTLIC